MAEPTPEPSFLNLLRRDLSLARSPLYNADGEQSGPGDIKGHMGGVSALSLIGTTEDWLSEKYAALAREI